MINRIINITLKEDKSFNLKSFKLGNKYENEITKVKFEIPEIFNDLTKRYIVLQNPDETRQFALPLQSDNSFILTTITSKESGNWKLLLLLKETELNGNITDETTENIVISDIITGTISNNYIEDAEINPESDPNLNIFYEDLEKQINYLSSQEFADLISSKIEDGATFTPSIDELGNLSWSNDKGKENPETVNIKGPKGDPGPAGTPGEKGEKGDPGPSGNFEDLTEEQKESLRGPAGADGEKGDKGDPGNDGAPGADGKSAYECWLEAGNTGTEEDFLNSLKGETGSSGNDGATFTPSIDELGNLSWTNDKGKENPESVNIKGPKGAQGPAGVDGEKGDKGDPGNDGAPGADGKSAYECWLEAGNVGTENDFINSIKGEKGDPGNDYNLTDTDKSDIAALVGSNFIVSGVITRIEIVDALPTTEEKGVLYLVKES